MLKWSLQLHKWLALVVGLQVLFWVVGGLIMTAIPIGTVRGEHHKPSTQAAALNLAEAQAPGSLAAGGAGVAEAALKSSPRGPVWALKTTSGDTLVFDARTGGKLEPLGEAQVRAAAVAAYAGSAEIRQVRRYDEAPGETGKSGALWRVDFDDPERTALYLSPETGEVVSRRSNVWRFYDFFWRLHILDFKDGENFNHPLIIAAAALTLPMVITGWVVLVIRLGRDAKRLSRRRPAAS
jgi:uncharacterized iron-regulated membrane protein